MISEIKSATVAVSDLAHSFAFYGKTFDYVSHAEGKVSGAGYEALWQMPAGMTGEVAVIGPEGATTGLLRLVQFSEPGTQIWGDYSTPQNYGHYALNIRVPEIKAAIAGIRADGGSGKSTPAHWTVSPGLSAWDSLSYDPDATILDCFELEAKEGSLMADYDGKYSTIQTVAIHSSDARESARYRGSTQPGPARRINADNGLGRNHQTSTQHRHRADQ